MKRALFLLCTALHTQEFSAPPFPAEIPDFVELPPPKPHKNAAIAVGLSSLVPGLGHYYLGDSGEGGLILGGTIASYSAAGALQKADQWELGDIGVSTGFAVSWYGMYAAYRDTKVYNGTPLGFTPKETFLQLNAAPFQWSVLKKPEVWGGYLGFLSAAVVIGSFFEDDASMRINTAYAQPLIAIPVAVGEEALFRGCLQSALLDAMPPWGAITVSSLLFGAAHLGNARDFSSADRRAYYTYSIPLITSAGAYMGWLAYQNRSLKESVALHMWYDFTLFAAEVFGGEAAIGSKPIYIEHSFAF